MIARLHTKVVHTSRITGEFTPDEIRQLLKQVIKKQLLDQKLDMSLENATSCHIDFSEDGASFTVIFEIEEKEQNGVPFGVVV